MTTKHRKLLEQLKHVILRRYQNVSAIEVHGSVARGDVEPFSDIDLSIVLKEHGPQRGYFGPFIIEGVLVTGEILGKKEYCDRFLKASGSEFFWVKERLRSTRSIYDPSGLVKGLRKQVLARRATTAITEDAIIGGYLQIVEYLGKLRNAMRKRDRYLARYAATVMGVSAQRVVVAVNRINIVNENTLPYQVLAAKRKPTHFNNDYMICVGYKPVRREEKIFRHAVRLAKEIQRFVIGNYGLRKLRNRSHREFVAAPF